MSAVLYPLKDQDVELGGSLAISGAQEASVVNPSSSYDGEKQSAHYDDSERIVNPAKNHESEQDFVVKFDGADDPENPLSWSRGYRWALTALACLICLNPSFASSEPAGAIPDLVETFGFSIEVGTLLVSIFVAGYCLGPILWAPLSEQYGRRIIFIISFIGFTAWNVGCALSQNTASILVFRFLSGLFGVSPLSNSGALLGDIWEPRTRMIAITLFTVIPVAGPALGPMIAGFISVSGADWRWGFWAMSIWSGVMLVIIAVALPETYAPRILVQKAQRSRRETGDNRWKAPLEMKQTSTSQRAADIVIKPWNIFFHEPILIAIHTFIAFQYGCLYLLFEAFPIVFGGLHGFDAGSVGLALLSIPVGGSLAIVMVLFVFAPRYAKRIAAVAPNPVAPEAILEIACFACVLIPIAFFWFGWTSYPDVSYWAPIGAVVLMIMGATLCLFSLQLFIINAYLSVSASALATNVMLRSALGAGFPLFARQMYETLNPRWASSVLGFISAVLALVPFLFVRYGPYLRSKSRYTQNTADLK